MIRNIIKYLENFSCQIKYFLTLATNAYDNSNMFPKEKKKYSQFLQGDYIVCYLLSSRSFLKTDEKGWDFSNSGVSQKDF